MKNKTKKGLLPIFLGILLLACAALLTAHNVRADRSAQESVRTVLEQMDSVPTTQPNTAVLPALPTYMQYPEMEMPVRVIDGGEYIGVIELPSLSLTLPVLSELTAVNLTVSPCRYVGSAYLDNLVIAAHNYTSHFARLRDLAYGDTVIFTDADGNVFTYEVAQIEMLAPTQVNEMTDGDWPLSLFTCTYGGGARVTVRCEKTEN